MISPYIKKFDGKGLQGLLDLKKDKFIYSLRPEIINSGLCEDPNRKFLLLHCLPRNTKKSIITNSAENYIFKTLHSAYCNNEKINPTRPPFKGKQTNPEHEKERLYYLKRYHKLKSIAKAATNGIIKESIKTADQEALRIAKRFHPEYRFHVYSACVKEEKIKQLFDVDPIFALNLIYENNESDDAVKDVIDGKKLNYIYKKTDWFSASKKIKPGILCGTIDLNHIFTLKRYVDNNILTSFIPKTTLQQQRWFFGLSVFTSNAYRNTPEGQNVIIWAVKNLQKPVENHLKYELHEMLVDMRDYIFARNLHGVRPFNQNMSFNAVWNNSRLWHIRLAENQRIQYDINFLNSTKTKKEIEKEQKENKYKLWFAGDWQDGEFSIEQIKNQYDLFQEGLNMKHCVATYHEAILSGDSIVFSLKKNGKRELTVEISKDVNGVFYPYILSQVRGICNQKPTNEQMNVVNKWFRSIRTISKKT